MPLSRRLWGDLVAVDLAMLTSVRVSPMVALRLRGGRGGSSTIVVLLRAGGGTSVTTVLHSDVRCQAVNASVKLTCLLSDMSYGVAQAQCAAWVVLFW